MTQSHWYTLRNLSRSFSYRITWSSVKDPFTNLLGKSADLLRWVFTPLESTDSLGLTSFARDCDQSEIEATGSKPKWKCKIRVVRRTFTFLFAVDDFWLFFEGLDARCWGKWWPVFTVSSHLSSIGTRSVPLGSEISDAFGFASWLGRNFGRGTYVKSENEFVEKCRVKWMLMTTLKNWGSLNFENVLGKMTCLELTYTWFAPLRSRLKITPVPKLGICWLSEEQV